MSVVKVQGNASGTGIFTVAAPATNTDRTLTLPDATGTVALQGGTGVGKVLQVVQSTYGTQVASTTDTFVDTGLTASITPSASSSKILVFVSQAGCEKSNANSSSALDIALHRVGTGSIIQFAGAFLETATALQQSGSASTAYLDSPATTSSVTYKTQFRSRNNTSTVYVQYAGVSTSTITLMEIAA